MLSGWRPRSDEVLAGLKDFQRATVEYVFQRLYKDQPGQRRFLVADETGLGKTLVARGVIAKAVEHLWDTVERIDVVYVCSNADIARQNINRLRIPGASEFALASRLTMLPVQVQDLKHSRLNFVSLTPGTSFDPKSKLGRWQERALLYLLLREPWGLRGKAPLNVFEGTKSTRRFRAQVKQFEAERTIDEELTNQFREVVAGRSDLRERCEELLERFGYSRKHIPREDARLRSDLIGELRACLAATCVEALEPDLVILDEFQRFKDLLDGDNEAAALARHLFDWTSGEEAARVLLLSATPYKMYTQAHERDDDHYRDFLRTVKFLAPGGDEAKELDGLLQDYRGELYRLGDGAAHNLDNIKAKLERCLRGVMVRTERLAVASDRDGMLRDATLGGLDLDVAEVGTYRALHDLADQVDYADPVEFWKSSPYLLSFMEGYQLKKRLDDRRAHAPSAAAIAETLREATGLSISREDIEGYAHLDPMNARLRWLLTDTVENNAWRMLWIPPSLSYYRPAGVWADPSLAGFTKRLIFSSWRVVPRMIAAMVSYAAERAAIANLGDEQLRWSNLRDRLSGPLRFDIRDGRAAGMTALTVVYPSLGLGILGDPLDGSAGERPLEGLRREVMSRIEQALDDLPEWRASGPEDERWYWAAPILMDLRYDEEAVSTFFDDETLPNAWSGEVTGDEDRTGWGRHVDLARDLVTGRIGLGAPPPDLADVLTDLALGAPGVCALRALSRIAEPVTLAERVIIRREAGRIGWAVRNLFNLSESVALLRGINQTEPYWRRVAEYCVAGNLQAVLDEYAHLLVESLGLVGQSSRRIMSDIGEQLCAVLSLRTSNPGFDEVVPEKGGFRIKSHRIRARFALRFGDERSEGDDGEGMRADQVRQAFNSPFWPFVLATTSVGQEGLDFHGYCHAVVHWNLPSNPVDLEQREGRVHRFKGHAIRKTVAADHRAALTDGHRCGDPWEALFQAAADNRGADSELAPYWVHGNPEGCRIERHVPVLPLSRDVLRFERLRRSLALYRMVFGQPRQDDLVAYLAERLSQEPAKELLDAFRIDLQPPPVSPLSVRAPPVTRSGRRVEPRGELGKAVIAVLDRYPLVVGRKVREGHPMLDALGHVASAIEAVGLTDGKPVGWTVDYEDRRRWLSVPIVWMWDERRHVKKVDDLTVELLLDPERDGVHVALGLQLLVDGEWIRAPLQAARRYRDRRRADLGEIVGGLTGSGFSPVPASQFLRGGGDDHVTGVAVVARFYGRVVLADDEELRTGIRGALAAYDDAYEGGLATPTREARALLR